jgi:hypothetical protein
MRLDNWYSLPSSKGPLHPVLLVLLVPHMEAAGPTGFKSIFDTLCCILRVILLSLQGFKHLHVNSLDVIP